MDLNRIAVRIVNRMGFDVPTTGGSHMKVLSVYFDGSNGFRRGDVLDFVPKGCFERNRGDGIWESEEGGSFYIELREGEPVRNRADWEAENGTEENGSNP